MRIRQEPSVVRGKLILGTKHCRILINILYLHYVFCLLRTLFSNIRNRGYINSARFEMCTWFGFKLTVSSKISLVKSGTIICHLEKYKT